MKFALLSPIESGKFRRMTFDEMGVLVRAGDGIPSFALSLVELRQGSRWQDVTFDPEHAGGRFGLFERVAPEAPRKWCLYLKYGARWGNESLGCKRVFGARDVPEIDRLESHCRSLLLFSTLADTPIDILMTLVSTAGWPQTSDAYKILRRNFDRDYETIPLGVQGYFGTFGEERPTRALVASEPSHSIDHFIEMVQDAFPTFTPVIVNRATFEILDSQGYLTVAQFEENVGRP